MSEIDAYESCPGGRGKQIKFCGCRDILPQMGRIIKSAEGNQFASALEQARKAIADHPDRACLLSLHAQLELQNENYDAAERAIENFTQKHPGNADAWAMAATIQGRRNGVVFAIEPIQRALEVAGREWSPTLYQSVRGIAQLLLTADNTLAGSAYLRLAAVAAGKEDMEVLVMLDRLNKAPHISLLLKQSASAEASDETPWSEAFDQAWKDAYRGRWLVALAQFSDLRQQYPDVGLILQSIACMHGWLCDQPSMAKALREIAALEGASHDNRVEAEATARIVDPAFQPHQLDVIRRTTLLTDGEAGLEKFASEPLLARMPIDLNTLGDEDNPAPRGAYWLLNRPIPASPENLVREDIPSFVAEVYLFGRETDRPARLESTYVRDANSTEVVKSLDALAGDLIDGESTEEVVAQTNEVEHILSVTTYFPDGTPKEVSRSLTAEEKRYRYFENWTELALPELGGKTPRQAASDSSLHLALLASLLLLELEEEREGSNIDFNELRKNLNLPTIESIDPKQNDVFAVRLTRLRRLDFLNLSDEGLASVFNRARSVTATRAGQLASEEIVRRGGIGEADDRIEIDDAYSFLATLSQDEESTLDYYDKGRQAAIDGGRSPANWLLRELEIRILRAERSRAGEILQQIQDNHMEEPGIADLLGSLLEHLGVAVNKTPPTPVAAAASGSDLWTPGGEAPSAASETEEPSKLWVPGME